jgi:threonine dehydratase
VSTNNDTGKTAGSNTGLSIEAYVKKILQASIYDVAEETPLEAAKWLSKRLDNVVLLKREDLQSVFSFKIRGAYNKIKTLTAEQLGKGVIAASAGNHAQGVALAANKLGAKAIIVMPTTTPDIKVNSVRSFGAEVLLFGDTFDAANKHALQLAQEKGYTPVHPYDDPDVIAGQGTIGMEILRQQSVLDAVFIPVGGGGLIAGVAAYLRHIRPEIKIIGVEPDDSACLYYAMKANERVVLPSVGLFADGVAVAQIGKEPFRLIQQGLVDEVILVNTDEICAAIKDIFEDTRSIAEPAGALSLAGLKKYVERERISGKHLLAIVSGANTNFDRLRYISERTELGEGREAILAVAIPEKPGSFKRFCELLGSKNITEFNYRYSDSSTAQVFVGVQMNAADRIEGRKRLIEQLLSENYKVVDMSGNELAKLHVRYMVGGQAPEIGNEVLFRFEFPERPGALLNFLAKIGTRWNISLFHYRNHGSAFGRVLIGLQVDDKEQVTRYLDEMKFPYIEETDNPAYQIFLNARK